MQHQKILIIDPSLHRFSGVKCMFPLFHEAVCGAVAAKLFYFSCGKCFMATLAVKQKARKCAECGEEFKGRVDKKFCSDQCRNTFNNRNNADATNHVRNINNILKKNRRILAELNPEGKARVHRNKLNELGFNFNYFTSQLKTQKGAVYVFCYEYGYLPLDNDFFFLVKSRDKDEERTAASS